MVATVGLVASSPNRCISSSITIPVSPPSPQPHTPSKGDHERQCPSGGRLTRGAEAGDLRPAVERVIHPQQDVLQRRRLEPAGAVSEESVSAGGTAKPRDLTRAANCERQLVCVQPTELCRHSQHTGAQQLPPQKRRWCVFTVLKRALRRPSQSETCIARTRHRHHPPIVVHCL
jgi:hypothetical protein